MKREQRVLMMICGEASMWDVLLAKLEMAYSPSLRAQHRTFVGVSSVLKQALGDPDDTVTIRTKNRSHRGRGSSSGALLLLGALVVVLILEWSTFTLPAIGEWLKYAIHRCGL
jgi:hypothetical protein